jgi:hypothetical protein
VNLYGPPAHWRDRPVNNLLKTGDDVVARAKLTNVGRMPCVIGDISLWARTAWLLDFGGGVLGRRMISEVSLSHGSLPLTLAPTEAVVVTLTANVQLAPKGAYFGVRAAVGRRQFSCDWTW